MDRIQLQGMRFYGYHGVTSSERQRGQPFEIDLEMEVDLVAACRSDRLADTVDYSQAYKIVQEVFGSTSFNLIEALAQAIGDRLLERFSLSRVVVRVRKPAASMPGPLSWVGVEISREIHPPAGNKCCV